MISIQLHTSLYSRTLQIIKMNKLISHILVESSPPSQLRTVSMPALVRNKCVHSDKTSNNNNKNKEVEYNLPIIQSVLNCPLNYLEKYNGEDEYIVDDYDLPIEEWNETSLRLKLPKLKQKKQTNGSYPFDVNQVGNSNLSLVNANNSPAKQYGPLSNLIHIGYTPINENDAFHTNMSDISVPSLPDTHFVIPRIKLSADKIIHHIREVVLCNENLHIVIPKNTLDVQQCCLYESSLIYTYFDETGYRAVKMQVSLRAAYLKRITIYSSMEGERVMFDDSTEKQSTEKQSMRFVDRMNSENIFVIVERLRGDTRPFLSVYNTLRSYIESDGITSCKVSPNMSSYSSTIGFDEIGFSNTNVSVFDK